MTTYWLVERSGADVLTGEGVPRFSCLLLMIVVSYVILRPVHRRAA
jgi:hypothetical protein